ncbi:MAG: stage II sporulation protein M [Gammaproteobacteria bacterium]|nr:stage II sporulation protein M [Gammaproteobacteria bacterium]
MKQDAFEAKYADDWTRLAEWTDALSRPRKARVDIETIAGEFPALYRRVCHHLALARARRYSGDLQSHLNRLALAGHQHLYRTRLPVFSAILRFFARDFPRAVRRHWRYMAVAAGLLFGPLLTLIVAIHMQPALVYSVLDARSVASMEAMYDPANQVLGRERESDTDLAMFGYYIFNNVGIGFRTFAGGLLFGIGSIFFLSFNGAVIGAVAGHLTQVGYGETFWQFVAAHSSFELIAIAIFGAAGLMLGMGALSPGRRKRWHAIQGQARAALPLVYGGTAFLVVAAFVEAFWSSSTWPPVTTKYAVGLLLWLLVLIYLLAFGRNDEA